MPCSTFRRRESWVSTMRRCQSSQTPAALRQAHRRRLWIDFSLGIPRLRVSRPHGLPVSWTNVPVCQPHSDFLAQLLQPPATSATLSLRAWHHDILPRGTSRFPAVSHRAGAREPCTPAPWHAGPPGSPAGTSDAPSPGPMCLCANLTATLSLNYYSHHQRQRLCRSELGTTTYSPRATSLQLGEGLAGRLQFGFEGGDLGSLLGARLLDQLVNRGREILVQFLRGA